MVFYILNFIVGIIVIESMQVIYTMYYIKKHDKALCARNVAS